MRDEKSKEELIGNIGLFMKTLESRWSVKINFAAVSSVFSLMSSFWQKILPHASHDNLLCNTVKKNEKCFRGCVGCKEKIEKRLAETKREFFGLCHFGFGEYVFPVLHRSALVAYLCVGEFHGGDEGISKLRAASKRHALDFSRLKGYYERTAGERVIPENEEKFFADFNALAVMLSYLYTIYDASDTNLVTDNPIVSGALDYISGHYSENLTLEKIAENVACNKNYLSTLFHEVVGLSLFEYIADYRIKAAINCMRVRDVGITELSYMCGFSSPAYFATVFKRYTGVTPREYKLNILKVNP